MLSINIHMTQSNDFMQQPSQQGLSSEKQSNPLNSPDHQNTPTNQSSDIAMQLLSMIISTLLKMSDQSSNSANGHNDNPQDRFNNPNQSNAALRDLGSSMLQNSVNPTADGGGQHSPSTSPLNGEVGKMMDNNQSLFGSPQNVLSPSTDGTASNSSSTGSNASLAKADLGNTENQMTPSTLGASSSKASSVNMFPTADSDNAIVLNEPIVVKAGETFDGKNQTYTASNKLGDGGQSETQKPLFVLEDGASLKNVILGDNEADGIHVHGDAKLDNVHWTDVGEDALTMKKGGTIEISNSSAKNADDKIFQLNDDGTLILNNVKADNFGKLVRTNGGQQGDWDIQLNNVTATNGKHALVQSDSNSVQVEANNVSTTNVKGMYILPESGKLTIS